MRRSKVTEISAFFSSVATEGKKVRFRALIKLCLDQKPEMSVKLVSQSTLKQRAYNCFHRTEELKLNKA